MMGQDEGGEAPESRGGELKVRPWRASLDTDLDEFCYKTGIYPYKRGKGILNDVATIMDGLYDENKATTIRELVMIPKEQYLSYGNFYGRRRRAEECWKATNKILRRHGFRMYKRPVVVDS